ncbi:MAG: CapA family protein [Acidimicrobiia bacterium]
MIRRWVALLAAILTITGPATALADEVTLAFTGDVLVHTPVTASAARHGAASGARHDFRVMLSEVAPVIGAADLALCHLETVIGVPGIEASPYPRIAAPAAVADGLAGAGFDGCSTASNHSLDFGPDGIVSTREAMEAAGLGATGTARTLDEAGPAMYRVGDAVLAHLSYSYGFNGFRVPAERSWLANAIDPDRIEAEAAAARRAGADLVVVSLHWGAEYRTMPTSSQLDLAERLRSSDDIDLVVGHHAHVVQPVAPDDGRAPLAFGLGNFLSNQTPGCCTVPSGDGVLLLVRAERSADSWHVTELAAVPTWVDRRAGHLIRPALAVDRPEAPGSADRTRTALTALGTEVPLFDVQEAVRWLSRHRMARVLERLCGGGPWPCGPAVSSTEILAW